MGRVKEMWMEACEREVEGYALGQWSRDDAYTRLVAFGVDPHDAANMLDQAKPQAAAITQEQEEPEPNAAPSS